MERLARNLLFFVIGMVLAVAMTLIVTNAYGQETAEFKFHNGSSCLTLHLVVGMRGDVTPRTTASLAPGETLKIQLPSGDVIVMVVAEDPDGKTWGPDTGAFGHSVDNPGQGGIVDIDGGPCGAKKLKI